MPKEHKRELSHRLAPSPLYPITDPQQDADFHMTAKSPLGPAPALPTSVENSYRLKCLELKKRIREIEDTNDVLVLRIQRSRRGIQRARLERAFLLQALEDRTDARVDDSEGSPSPPPTVSIDAYTTTTATAIAASNAIVFVSNGSKLPLVRSQCGSFRSKHDYSPPHPYLPHTLYIVTHVIGASWFFYM